MLNPFQYFAPESVPQASELLRSLGPRARALAGGTALLPAAERGQLSLEAVINLKRLPGLRQVAYDPERGLTLGALVTLAEVLRHPLVRAHAPVLAETAGFMATPQARQLATVGGNLCSGAPAADLLVTMLALEAELTLANAETEWSLPLAAWLTPWGRPALEPGDLLIRLRLPPVRGRSLYRRFMLRAAVDVPLANLALALDGDQARLVLGANGPRPTRMPRAEQAILAGRPAAEIAELASADYYPADDQRASRWYRREVMRVLLTRALAEL